EGATAQRADPTVNVAMPTRNIRLRPIRSATRPAGTRSAPNTIAYAFRTQERSLSDVPEKSRASSGNAMLTMNRSRLATKTPSEVTIRIRQRLSIRSSGFEVKFHDKTYTLVITVLRDSGHLKESQAGVDNYPEGARVSFASDRPSDRDRGRPLSAC